MEFTQAAKRAGIKPILGATVLVEGQPTWLYVQNATGYHNLCRLLSTTVRHADSEEELNRAASGPYWPARIEREERWVARGRRRHAAVGDIWRPFLPPRCKCSMMLKQPAASRCVAVMPIHYAERNDRWKWNIVQSIRTRTLLRQAHPAKILDGDFHLRSPAEMTNLFARLSPTR